jgi:hypothetical protein
MSIINYVEIDIPCGFQCWVIKSHSGENSFAYITPCYEWYKITLYMVAYQYYFISLNYNAQCQALPIHITLIYYPKLVSKNNVFLLKINLVQFIKTYFEMALVYRWHFPDISIVNIQKSSAYSKYIQSKWQKQCDNLRKLSYSLYRKPICHKTFLNWSTIT